MKRQGNSRKPFTFLITAGPTIESIDPVRFLSNFSTGRMGCEIAAEARRRGHRVILVHGPIDFSCRPLLKGLKAIGVMGARQMRREVLRHYGRADCVIMAAAVSDFTPVRCLKGKIKRHRSKTLLLKLRRNPDILAELGERKRKQLLIGFSLETSNEISRARDKLNRKNLDMVVANTVGGAKSPFGGGLKNITILRKTGKKKEIKEAGKHQIAGYLIRTAENLLEGSWHKNA